MHALAATSPVSPFFDPNTQYVFGSWSDGVTTATRSVTVPASGVLSLSVNYNANYHATSNVNAACAGSASLSPAPPNSGFVASGSQFIATAAPVSPFVFAGWGGTITGSANPLSTTVNSELIATANFNLVNAPLTVTLVSPSSVSAGTGAQSVTLSGSGFSPTGSYVFVNSSLRTTTYVNSTTLTVALTAADVATAGVYSVDVDNYNPSYSCAVVASGSLLVTP